MKRIRQNKRVTNRVSEKAKHMINVLKPLKVLEKEYLRLI